MARPCKFNEPLIHIIKIRCTSSEREQFIKIAEATGLSVADILRRKLLGLKIPDKTQINTLFAIKNLERQLRKIGGLIKHLYLLPPQGMDPTEYANTTLRMLNEQESALREVTQMIKRLNPDDN